MVAKLAAIPDLDQGLVWRVAKSNTCLPIACSVSGPTGALTRAAFGSRSPSGDSASAHPPRSGCEPLSGTVPLTGITMDDSPILSGSAGQKPNWPEKAGPPEYPFSLGSSADDRVAFARGRLKEIINETIFLRVPNLIAADPLLAFIYMACVIDYLAGFARGSGKTTQTDYEDFVERYFAKAPDGTSIYGKTALYQDLRCDLVHNLTIGHTYVLTHQHPEHHLARTDRKATVLDAGSFYHDLIRARDQYYAALDSEASLCHRAVERYRQEMVGILEFRVAKS